ncbi:hypothetical protein [Sphingomonas sp. LHG3406-1]|uniref:hypothetical protein n=1 Tax=Sphingomonas sp. LHG3406-1 TaxID=2804617 RepID=UPI00261046DB|nr:hypothetical protein [Sphingomonas sp. LHG3406-1]
MIATVPKVIVDWSGVHEPTDGPDPLAQHLNAGRDEGPLLVIPALSSRRRRVEGKIFADLIAYEKHLLRYEEDVRIDRSGTLSAPRWTGLVRRNRADSEARALSAIYGLKTLLAPPVQTVFHPPRARLRSTQDYQVMPGPYRADRDILIENIGDGFEDMRRAFPGLTREMMCSPDGLVTPLRDDDE